MSIVVTELLVKYVIVSGRFAVNILNKCVTKEDT
jgi:hypothetical protein